MIDYSKVLTFERLQRIRRAAEQGHSMTVETVTALLDHAKVLDMALQSLTPGGSEYVNDPKRCVEYCREVRETQHQLILGAVDLSKTLAKLHD